MKNEDKSSDEYLDLSYLSKEDKDMDLVQFLENDISENLTDEDNDTELVQPADD